MNDAVNSKRVLVAPLDWGLGHATRCIPVIKELKKQRAQVFIASSGNALTVLKDEFPELTFFEIASYGVRYSLKLPFMLNMILLLPRFQKAITAEYQQIEKIVANYNIDVIISDNRYGCYSKETINVFITHQLNIQLPLLLRWTQGIVNSTLHKKIKAFDHCWIPDDEQRTLTETLTKSNKIQTRSIGMLSRLEAIDLSKRFDLLFLLSGPEPQRTLLEEIIVKQLPSLSDKKILIVRGITGEDVNELEVKQVNCEVNNYLGTKQLNEAMAQSELVVCRPGYSTIMDLAKLNKKALFIPTDGQTEQEYLADVLMKRNVAFAVPLKQLNLKSDIKSAEKFTGFTDHIDQQLLEEAITELLS